MIFYACTHTYKEPITDYLHALTYFWITLHIIYTYHNLTRASKNCKCTLTQLKTLFMHLQKNLMSQKTPPMTPTCHHMLPRILHTLTRATKIYSRTHTCHQIHSHACMSETDTSDIFTQVISHNLG